MKKKTYKCKSCKALFKSPKDLDNHWVACWEKTSGKKYFVILKNNIKKIIMHTNSSSSTPHALKNQNLKNQNTHNTTQTNATKNKITASIKYHTQGVKFYYQTSECSCRGENSNCFKCNGTGHYRKKMVTPNDEKLNQRKPHGQQTQKTRQESNFSNDLRGGTYGIRENGRFSSNPLHDDHDE